MKELTINHKYYYEEQLAILDRLVAHENNVFELIKTSKDYRHKKILQKEHSETRYQRKKQEVKVDMIHEEMMKGNDEFKNI